MFTAVPTYPDAIRNLEAAVGAISQPNFFLYRLYVFLNTGFDAHDSGVS